MDAISCTLNSFNNILICIELEMEIICISEIISTIGIFLEMNDFVTLSETNRSFNKIINHDIKLTKMVNLQFLRNVDIYEFINYHHFRKINMSNTMITDDFPGELLMNCHELILHHCHNITDNFINK